MKTAPKYPSLLILTILVLAGAGRHPWVLAGCTGLACASLLPLRPPARKSLLILWWTGMAVFGWHLFTLAPLPLAMLGANRTEFFEQADRQLAALETTNLIANRADSRNLGRDQPQVQTSVETDVQNRIGTGYGRLTLNLSGTRRFIIIAIGAWAMFWISTAMTLEQRLRFMACLVAGGAIIAVLGLVGRYMVPFGNRIWWLFPVEHQVGGGPFVNRNHFASFCAILAPAALSLFLNPIGLFRMRLAGRHDRRPNLPGQPTARPAGHGGWRLLYAICLAALISAPILSLSRGGMIMLLLGCLTTAICWIGGRPGPALLGSVAMITLFFAFLMWPSEAVQDRIATIRLLQQASPARPRFMREAFSQWRDFPMVGGGADSFRAINGLYRLQPAAVSPLYAENEYAQLLADHGLLGAGLIGIMLLAMLNSFRDRFPGRRRGWPWTSTTPPGPAELATTPNRRPVTTVSLPVLAAVIGATVGLLFHFTCDFPARVPLNAFLIAALLGLAMPLPGSGQNSRTRFPGWPRLVFFPLAFILLIAWGPGDGLRLDEPVHLQRAGLETVAEAVAAAPTYWVAWSRLSYLVRIEAEKQIFGEKISIHHDSNPFAVYHLGVEYLEIAANFSPRDHRLWQRLIQARLRFGASSPEQVAAAMEQAARVGASPRAWREWLSFILLHYPFEEALEIGRTALVGESPAVAAAVWQEIYQWSSHEGMKEEKDQALQILSQLRPDQPRWWQEIANSARQDGRTEEAITAYLRLTELQPGNWRFWLELGKLQLEEGETEKASRAFSRALGLRPQLTGEVDRMWRDHHLK